MTCLNTLEYEHELILTLFEVFLGEYKIDVCLSYRSNARIKTKHTLCKGAMQTLHFTYGWFMEAMTVYL